MSPDFTIENNYPNQLIAGIDEAGRGPLAGPVVAACAILNPADFLGDKADDLLQKINDSKKLTKIQRGKIFARLREKITFGVGIVDAKTIDDINILQATKLAMLRAVIDLQHKCERFPEVLLVDGNFIPFDPADLDEKHHITTILPVIKGDQKSLSIAAASIIAKETRDAIMTELHDQYPAYGFNKHAGYPTAFHRQQITTFGICDCHRRSFEPIKSMLS